MNPPEELLEGAEAGDAEAQCDLGRFYIEQAGEHEKGVRWFFKAAEQGLPRAHHNLGVIAVRSNALERAKAHFMEASVKGWANSQQALGAIFRQEGNMKGAEALFRSAAERGNAQALDDLADMEMDRETHEGYRNALRLARAAADKGVASASRRLFLIYNEGLGVPQDQVAAAGFLKTGAHGGDTTAQGMYGIVLDTGKFVKRDVEEAAFMLSMAAQRDDSIGKIYVWRVVDKLSRKQLVRLNERLRQAGYQGMSPGSARNRFWRVWIRRPLIALRFRWMLWTGQGDKLAHYKDEMKGK